MSNAPNRKQWLLTYLPAFAVVAFASCVGIIVFIAINELQLATNIALGIAVIALIALTLYKTKKLDHLKAQHDESLSLLEKQLEDVQKSEADKTALHEQLHQAQKLEALGRLAGGIAHDFNNILAAIKGYAEFLSDDLKKGSEQYEYADNILKAGKQAGDLVEKMLTFSRQDQNETQQMHLSDSLDATIAMLKASLPKTVDLVTDVEDEEYIIHGNPTLLSQAIMNLCVNAKDAMPNEKGKLMLSLSLADMEQFEEMEQQKKLPATSDMPLVDIEELSPTHTCLRLGSVSKDQEYLCLSVADNGSGMTHAIMENIFEPFFTTKPVDEGTGLGLAMVHGVIASHRGAMQIHSIAGKGTRFDLLFPTLGKGNEQTVNIEDSDDWQAIGHVLLVEDQGDVREMMQTMLTRIGFEAETCDDGQAALEILKEHPDYFNAVITDQNMPKMTGIELIENIAKDYPDIPFVLVTGYSIDKMRDIMKDHPSVKAILKKPVNREKLKEAVQKAVFERQFAA